MIRSRIGAKNHVGLQGEVDGVGKVDVPGFREPVDGRRQAWVSVRDEVRIPYRAAANRQGRQVTTATPAMLDLRLPELPMKAVQTRCLQETLAVWCWLHLRLKAA